MSRTYVTVQGDRWDDIALRELGAERYVEQLFQANLQLLHILVFDAGTKLVLPDIQEPVSERLPFWRR